MKIDAEIYESAVAQGMPRKPLQEQFQDEVQFEEAIGWWMSRFGRTLAIRQQMKDASEEKK